MVEEHPKTELQMLLSLEPGDKVEAWDSTGGCWTGAVETAAPQHGIVWIVTDSGERKLFDVYEHSIELITGHTSTRPPRRN